MTYQPHTISTIQGGRVEPKPKPRLVLQLPEGTCTVIVAQPLLKQFTPPFKAMLAAVGLPTDWDPSPDLPERVLFDCIAMQLRFRFNKVRRQKLDRYKKPIPGEWTEAFYLKGQSK